jgi:predicted RNA-binding protein YlqC (UPF0109 family)
MTTILALISDICTAIVGDHFRLVVKQGDATVLVEIFAPWSSTGALIGREGQLVEALRVVLTAAGYQIGHRVYVRVEVE